MAKNVRAPQIQINSPKVSRSHREKTIKHRKSSRFRVFVCLQSGFLISSSDAIFLRISRVDPFSLLFLLMQKPSESVKKWKRNDLKSKSASNRN